MLSAPAAVSSRAAEASLVGKTAAVSTKAVQALFTSITLHPLLLLLLLHHVTPLAVSPCRWDHTVRLFGEQAIIVYPQSTGNPGTGNPSEGQGAKYRQVWSWWWEKWGGRGLCWGRVSKHINSSPIYPRGTDTGSSSSSSSCWVWLM
jgi:hypothetical protein